MSASSEQITYFRKEPKIYPKRVWGRYRKIKWLVMAATLGVYYLAPFIRWDRGADAPDQAILIDIAGGRAYFFFIEIWTHEVYYLTGLLILAAVALFFITAVAGRIWCGYLCFQTVWTDLFVWVERIIQGDRHARRKLDVSSWSMKKLWQKGLTHLIWLLIGLMTGGAWVFYFNDAPTLLEQIWHRDVPAPVAGWIVALTFTTYLMAGFARQQVCKYMCPYARFQSAMFDRNTLIIGYDTKRGEPRGKLKEKQENTLGDCVDCSLCVQVCPMGIDIREGLQYECIACGLCIDACNGVMDKIDLPRGLIRYDTATNQQARDAGKEPTSVWSHLVRPRTTYYVLMMALVGGVMIYSLIHRAPLELHVLHDRNPLFVTLSDGSIRNGYEIRILNKTHTAQTYRLHVSGIAHRSLHMQGAGVIDPQALSVFADSVGHFRLFLVADAQPQARQPIRFHIASDTSEGKDTTESVFISAR